MISGSRQGFGDVVWDGLIWIHLHSYDTSGSVFWCYVSLGVGVTGSSVPLASFALASLAAFHFRISPSVAIIPRPANSFRACLRTSFSVSRC